MTSTQLPSRVSDALRSLNSTQHLLDRANSRLSSGLAVSSSVDDPVAFFKSQALNDRASAFESRKSDIAQGINALKTTSHALSSLVKFVDSIKGQVSALQGADSAAQFNAYKATFTSMLKQYSELAKDAKYNGQNLIVGTKVNIEIKFSNDPSRKLTIVGKDERASMIGLTGGNRAGFTVDIETTVNKAAYDATSNVVTKSTELDLAIDNLGKVADLLKADAVEFGGNLSILNLRSEFTEQYTQDLQVGANDLVAADMQKEGANLLALQTRQALALNSLSLASNQDSAVLQLLR